jgi:hypothetical protein
MQVAKPVASPPLLSAEFRHGDREGKERKRIDKEGRKPERRQEKKRENHG